MAMITMPMKSAAPCSKGPPPSLSPPACAMESSSSRMQRNFAEKQRRDKLNSYINELANIVPMVSMASKRLDKTSILRLSAAHLRFYQTPLAPERNKVTKAKWRPKFLSTDHLKDLLEVCSCHNLWHVDVERDLQLSCRRLWTALYWLLQPRARSSTFPHLWSGFWVIKISK